MSGVSHDQVKKSCEQIWTIHEKLWKNGEKLWKSHEQVVHNLWRSHEQFVKKNMMNFKYINVWTSLEIAMSKSWIKHKEVKKMSWSSSSEAIRVVLIVKLD